MAIGFLGASFKQHSIEEFEPLYFIKEGLDTFLSEFPTTLPFDGIVFLMTCNRFEIYFSAKDLDKAKDFIISAMANFKQLDPSVIAALLTYRSDKDAIEHLFSVASGIDSMVIGENEILTQVKQSYEYSRDKNYTDTLLNKLFQTAVAVGKKVRSQTEISRGAYSVSSIAIEAIRNKYLDYFGKSILVVGAGMMAYRTLKKLSALGHPDVSMINRTKAKADAIAEEMDIKALDFNLEHCNQFDIVIFATSTKYPIFTKDKIIDPEMTQLFIDLGVPRNVDPEISSLEDKSTITVGGLREIAAKSIHRRQAEVTKVQDIIDAEMDRYQEWVTFRTKNLASQLAG